MTHSPPFPTSAPVTPQSTTSALIATLVLALVPTVVLYALSYPTTVAVAGAVVVGTGLLVGLLRRFATARGRVRLPGVDVEVAFSRPSR